MNAPRPTAQTPLATILIVEDDRPLLHAAARFLERKGFRVLTAEDAQGAHQAWQESGGEIDVLLCDLVLPGLSGREVANVFLARRPEVKVIYTSGYSSYGSFRWAVSDGGEMFLSKPFDLADLAAAVEAALAGPGVPPEPRT